ncbi:hypothetical protein Agub_g5923 [Astrephomene gubernaculifera]|uniref:Uncharacterized protein n=1 Tax=Astrephomene gubernaculifera TaxID=47775 RepID=A0AAD3DMK6_9CHLO|nr:hypothetical protein Agub_g5923 [Astrephomene gubernaculifera]
MGERRQDGGKAPPDQGGRSTVVFMQCSSSSSSGYGVLMVVCNARLCCSNAGQLVTITGSSTLGLKKGFMQSNISAEANGLVRRDPFNVKPRKRYVGNTGHFSTVGPCC